MKPGSFQHSVRRIVPLAWPVLVGQVSVLAFSTVDTVLVARHSTADLAALAVGGAAYITVFIGLMGVVLALSPIVGRLYGAGQLSEAGAQLHQAIWLSLGLALLGSSLLAFPAPFLALSHASPDVAAKVRGYLAALALALPASLLFTAFRAFNTAVSRPTAVMALQLATLGLVIDMEASPRLAALCDGPVVVADEEALPFRPESLDLVVSGLALQHANDVPGALAQIRRALKPDGLLLASVLGGATLHELRQAFVAAESETAGGASPRVAPFADVRDFGGLLQRAGFALPVADADIVEAAYPDALALMRDLAGMGMANALVERRRAFLRRDTLFRAAEIYAERFARPDGRIIATFEIITLTGWVPHPSQQQPLRPGSAKSRLAEALGVPERPAGSHAGEE